MRKAARRFRIPRLWKLAAVAVLGFSLLALGSVFAMRALPHPGCVIYYDSGREIWEYDLSTGTILRFRSANDLLRIYSPDRLHYATVGQASNGTFTLYVSKVVNGKERANPIPIQRGLGSSLGVLVTSNRFVWKGDRLAFMWVGLDDKIYLTAAKVDGSEVKQTLFESRNGPATLSSFGLVGLSADGSFLIVDEGFSEQGSSRRYRVWSVRELTATDTLLDDLPTITGAWSHSGHEFAAIIESSSTTTELIMFSLDTASISARVKRPPKDYSYLMWSPDNRYLMVASPVRETQNFRRWHYDIYAADGRLLYDDMVGDETYATTTGTPLTATWADATHLLYLKERPVVDRRASDLILLDVETGLNRVLAANIMIPFRNEMFFPPPSQTQTARVYNSPLVVPQGAHLLIPRWVGGKVTVELARLNGQQRTVLVEDADLLFSPQASMSEDTFWSADGRWVRLLWVYSRDGRQRVRLTVAKSDGSLMRTFDGDLDDITALRSVYLTEPQAWVGFIGTRGRQRGIEVFNAETGEHRPIVTGLDRREQTWNLVPNPGGSHVLVTIANVLGQAGSRLYLVLLEGGEQVEVTQQMLGAALWSPDGQHVLYLTQVEGTKFALEMVNLDGSSAGQMVVNNRFDGETILRSWTRCDMEAAA